jgi:hypothetical protein
MVRITPWELALLAIAVSTIGGYLYWLYLQKVSWHAEAKRVAAFSEIVHLPRKPGENLSAWEKRVVVALDELYKAGDEFLAAARREGSVERVNERVEHWKLPSDHPAAVRYAKARGTKVSSDG